MTYQTVQVYSGSPVTARELLVLAEFAAPSHFVSDHHLFDAAANLAEWTDDGSAAIDGALHLASVQAVRPSVVQLLRATATLRPGSMLARAS